MLLSIDNSLVNVRNHLLGVKAKEKRVKSAKDTLRTGSSRNMDIALDDGIQLPSLALFHSAYGGTHAAFVIS